MKNLELNFCEVSYAIRWNKATRTKSGFSNSWSGRKGKNCSNSQGMQSDRSGGKAPETRQDNTLVKASIEQVGFFGFGDKSEVYIPANSYMWKDTAEKREAIQGNA